MKRNILLTLLFLLILAAYGFYRSGQRKITINVDGKAAAGQEIRLVKTGETIELDDKGTLDLDWGFDQLENPAFLFQAGPTNIMILRMPEKGSLTFDIVGAEVTTDAEVSYGLFKLKKSTSQELQPLPRPEKRSTQPMPKYGPRVGVDPFADTDVAPEPQASE